MIHKQSPNELITDQGPARALIYLRVSTKEQATTGGSAEGFSIPAQREACKRKAASLGAVVDEEFVDAGESARSKNRPELQRMLKYVDSESVDYVIVHKVDRLARNRADDVEIGLALKNAGVTLVSCTENIDETPSGVLLHGIMSSIAEFYSRNLANEVIKGLTQKAKTGGTPGRVPPGYLNVIKRDNGRELRTVEVDPERGALVNWAFETYAKSEHTLVQLTDELDAMGLTSMPTANRAPSPLSRSTINRMLRNPYYIGIVSYQGVQYEGTHEQLVSKETWYRVQAVLDAHNAGEKRRLHPHYLKGSIFCGECGSRLCFDRKTNRHGSVYEYFFCVGRHQKRNTCARRYAAVDELEDKILAKWRGVRLAAKYAEALETILRQELQLRRSTNKHTRAIASRKLRTLREQQQKLLDAYYEGAVPLALLKTEQDRLARELRHTEEQLIGAELSDEQTEQMLAACLDFAQRCDRVYAAAPTQLRRQMNQAMFEKFFIDEDGEVMAELAGPFKVLLDPQLLGTQQATIESDVAKPLSEARYHRSSEWKNGLPAWLADLDHRRLPRLHLYQGSKESHLAEGVGFEPTVSCPTHAFQACRFGRSRTPPEPQDRSGGVRSGPLAAHGRRPGGTQALPLRAASFRT